MSVSISKLLNLAFGIKNVILKKFYIEGERAIFYCHLKKKAKRCARCNSRNINSKGSKIRRLRMLPLGTLKCFIHIKTYKYKCLDCQKYGWCRLPFALGKFPLTQAYARYLLSLVKLGTIQSIAIFTGLSWKTVKNIHKTELQKRFKKKPYKQLRCLSVDEFSIKRGHTYMTVFTDVSTGRIIHAVEGRSVDDIKPFLVKLSVKAPNLKAIAMDMSKSYISAVENHLPGVKIVFDRFHISKLLNEAVDEVRRVEKWRLEQMGLQTTKGDRFLLLRNFDDLNNKQVNKLDQLLEMNKSIAKAHTMKEQLRVFWHQNSKGSGARFLLSWILEATISGIPALERVAKTLLKHSEGLLNYFEFPINNGKAEGINNKIKVLKRRGYGYNDTEYFKLLLYQLHEKQTVLAG